jgi:hypothetical protein
MVLSFSAAATLVSQAYEREADFAFAVSDLEMLERGG